jgi:hypothetical protein
MTKIDGSKFGYIPHLLGVKYVALAWLSGQVGETGRLAAPGGVRKTANSKLDLATVESQGHVILKRIFFRVKQNNPDADPETNLSLLSNVLLYTYQSSRSPKFCPRTSLSRKQKMTPE